jgi:hypothetical protein
MNNTAVGLLLLVTISPSLGAQGAHVPVPPDSHAVPVYTISFERGEQIPGLDAPAVVLPFQCTEDGTVFFNQPRPPDPAAPFAANLEISSVSVSREVHSFPLNHVPDLYDIRQRDYYGSDSNVVFLVKAARENKQAMQTLTAPDRSQVHGSENVAEHYSYVLVFDREGKFQEAVQIDEAFQIVKLSVFPSGTFLAYGYDKSDQSPKLAMLKDDGKLIKFLEIPPGDAPESALTSAPSDKGSSFSRIAPVQFVPSGRNIIVVQNKTSFPLLEVNEAGAIRAIRADLPNEAQINTLIPSDNNLYARVNEGSVGTIYELNTRDGSVLRKFRMAEGGTANIACVHERKFLSFETWQGKLLPLFGSMDFPAAPSPDR